MNIEKEGDILRVNRVKTLDAANSSEFQRRTISELEATTKRLEINMSHVRHLDCFGVGVLIALRDLMRRRGGELRVLEPSPPARQFMDLTRANRLLNIVKIEDAIA
jgi:anti-anti-sigma factor